jgi:hypothetical protein
MSTEIAIQEAEIVPAKTLTTEESVEFKLSAHQKKAIELKAIIANGIPTIAGIGDKVGYAKVSTMRKEAMRARTALDADRKALTAEARRYQDLVNSRAKTITADIETVENTLFSEEDRIDKLIEADKTEKQRIINERVSSRTQSLISVRHDVTGITHLLAGMPEDQYQIIYQGAKAKFDAEEAEAAAKAAELARLQAEEAERKRIAEEAEAKARREESARLEAQRKAQEAEQAKLAAERAEIEAAKKALADAEAKRIADAKAAQDAEERKAREAVIAAEAAECARLEAEAKAKAEAERKEREAKDAETKRIADEKAKAEKLAAIEAAKPDVEKLRDFADLVRKISLPALTTKKGENVIRLLRVNLDNLVTLIKSEADGLTK